MTDKVSSPNAGGRAALPLLLGGSGLVRGAVKNFGLALRDLAYELSAEMANAAFLSGAPFVAFI